MLCLHRTMLQSNHSNFLLRSSVASRNLFFVFLTGNTNGAHCDLVEKLKDLGHTEVNTPEECDYVVVFCPVASRVGAEVSRALSKMPGKSHTGWSELII